VRRSILIALLILFLTSLACGGTAAPAMPTPTCQPSASAIMLTETSRSFYMGFTRWPPEATLDGIQRMDNFIASHSDLAALHFDGGIPWPEALADGDYPSAVINDWKGARDSIPQGHKLYVAITPLDMSRAHLAPYWGTANNQPLPKPWDGYQLNSPEVKRAYLNFARRVIEYFHPDYFAIGVEVNIAQVKSTDVWNAYKELHQYIYENLKKENPDLPIFATFSNSHMNGFSGGNRDAQKTEITKLLKYSDLFGLSVYPYGPDYHNGGDNPAPIPNDLFDTALSFGKPVVVAESGMPSADFSTFGMNFKFTPEYQEQWIQFLMKKAQENHFLFVVNWLTIDFDKLLKDFPSKDTRELATFWVYTGLQRSDGCNKKALATWDAYLKLNYSR